MHPGQIYASLVEGLITRGFGANDIDFVDVDVYDAVIKYCSTSLL